MNKNRDYAFKVYKDEFNDWVCEYTDIPGLIGVGDSKEEAISEADIFLNQYLDQLDEEGKEYPVIADGFTYSGRITVRVSKTTHKKIVEASDKNGVSINQWITDAINEHIGRWQISTEISKAFEMLSEFLLHERGNKQQYNKEIYDLFDRKEIKQYYEGKLHGR